MRRLTYLLPVVVVGLSLTGCSAEKTDVTFEATGDPGVTAVIKIVVQGENRLGAATGYALPDENGPLPWSGTRQSMSGETWFTVTASTGAATCRILVGGKELTKVVGKPGQPVECSTKV